MRAAGIAWVLVACGGDPAPPAPTAEPATAPLALETAIAEQLGGRVNAVVSVVCGALPPRCTATLPDGARIPIRLASTRDGWTWHVDKLLVAADPIEAYLRDTLADLGAVQRVTCAPRIRVLDAGDRIACALERGGKAFVTVAADGSFAVELELDPAAAAARSEDLGSRLGAPALDVPAAGSGEDDD